jgi:hypothetical protein
MEPETIEEEVKTEPEIVDMSAGLTSKGGVNM